MIKEIMKDEIFGHVKAYVYRIEWQVRACNYHPSYHLFDHHTQARGMPHAHCLFILKDKILSARHIDSVVSAEVPDPITEPELYELVATHMMHPICDVDTSHGCRHDANDKICDCRRHFPKQMSPTTVIVADGYPIYKRRGRNTITMRDGRIVTDNWVVPFNKQDARMYVCSIINVTIVTGIFCSATDAT